MKALLFGASLFCLMILLTMDSCSEITGDECDNTMMKKPDEPTIYLKLFLNTYDSPQPHRNIFQADIAVFTGTITKFYCGDKKSGSFDFTHTLYLSKDYTENYLTSSGVLLQQPYTFKFENDGDYLVVKSHMKLYFNDGKIFESDEGQVSYYYYDIVFDVNQWNKYIKVHLPGVIVWKEIT